MSNELNVPAELIHLIEKREQADRRTADRREDEPSQCVETPVSDRREGDRRGKSDRRASDG